MKSVLNPKVNLLMALVAFLSMGYQPAAFATSDDVTGYFVSETNECPEALRNLQKTGKWPGVTITPVQILYPDGKACSLSNENPRLNTLSMTLTCPNDLKQSGEYGFTIHDNELQITRKGEQKSYVRCRNLNLGTPSELSTRQNPSAGYNVGGTKVRPFGNNSSMGMRMNTPF